MRPLPVCRRTALCLAAAAAPHAPLLAQSPSHAGAFVVRLGIDTTAVERFARTGNAYSVEQLLRSPTASLRHTHLELAPGGEIAQIFFMQHRIGAAPNAPLLGSVKLTYAAGDSATVETRRGDSASARSVAFPRGAVPSLPQSFLPYELAAMRMRASGADSMTLTLVGPTGTGQRIVARRLGADSMLFVLPFLTYRARVDRDGRILSLYQPLGTVVERVPAVDVNRLAESWAALDAAGKGMGPLSPLDSMRARVGDATVAVRYSRPKTRGRVIFGNIVQWDSVWRTGANQATVFTTDRDLMIGDAQVPAGSYTLFAIPSRTGTKLILSKETTRGGQPLAGTDYDPKHDLARIDMRTTTLAAPVEQFTIEVRPRGSGRGELRLAWDRREMTVPIRVRR